MISRVPYDPAGVSSRREGHYKDPTNESALGRRTRLPNGTTKKVGELNQRDLWLIAKARELNGVPQRY